MSGRGRHHTAPGRAGIAARFAGAFVLAVMMSLVLGPPGRDDRDWRDFAGGGALTALAIVLTVSATERCIERFEAVSERLDDWIAETYERPGCKEWHPHPSKIGPYRGDLGEVPPPADMPYQTEFPAWAEATARLDYPGRDEIQGPSAAALRPIAVPVFRSEADRVAWADRYDVPTEILPRVQTGEVM